MSQDTTPADVSPVLSSSDPTRMALAEHLGELRRRLAICLAAVLIASCVGFALAERLIGWLKRPAEGFLPRLAFFSPTEALVAYLKVAVGFGVVVALPVILAQLWAFVRPALSWRERFYGMAFVWWGSLLFIGGAAFAYVVCLPLFLRFLLRIGEAQLVPIISVSRYLGFATGVMLTCGVLFEVPLAMVFLTRVGLITPATLRRQRGIALLGLVVVAAFVTPTTDAISLLLMTIPLLGLYELAIVVSQWAGRPPRLSRR